MAIKLATGPVTRGVDLADTPTNPPRATGASTTSPHPGCRRWSSDPVGYPPRRIPARCARCSPSAIGSPPDRSFDDHPRPVRARSAARHRRARQQPDRGVGRHDPSLTDGKPVRWCAPPPPGFAGRGAWTRLRSWWGQMVDQLERAGGRRPPASGSTRCGASSTSAGIIEFEDEIEAPRRRHRPRPDARHG